MSAKIKITKLQSLSLAILLLLICCGPLAETSLPTDARVGNCLSDADDSLTTSEFNGWFVDDSVSLNGVVEPANSVTFPDRPNMTFYKWAEQMFLWLTSAAPASYGGGDFVFNSPAFFDVTPPDLTTGRRQFVEHSVGKFRVFDARSINRGLLGLPIVFERKTLRVMQILPPVLSASGKQLVLDKNGAEVEIGNGRMVKGIPTLFDTKGKEIIEPKAIIRSRETKLMQPFELKMLKIQKAGQFDKSLLVQKISLGKESFFLSLSGSVVETEINQASGEVLMAVNTSLVYYSLTVNNVFMLQRTMQPTPVSSSLKFPTTQAELDAISAFAVANGRSPMIDSQALAVEIKGAWIEANKLPNSDHFIKIKAEIPTYNTSDPNHWVKTGTKTATLAMVGMHVVGSAKGHPEMLWATFEHVSNCPSVGYKYDKLPTGTATVARNTTGNWLFCASGSAGPFNEQHISLDFSTGDLNSVGAFTVSSSNILRTAPWGMDSASNCSNAQIISLNNKVRSLLDTGDVRRHYLHIGTTWTIGGASPSGGNIVGTSKLANTTMETFVQEGTLVKCFECHVTNTTAVSHIFDETDPLFTP